MPAARNPNAGAPRPEPKPRRGTQKPFISYPKPTEPVNTNVTRRRSVGSRFRARERTLARLFDPAHRSATHNRVLRHGAASRSDHGPTEASSLFVILISDHRWAGPPRNQGATEGSDLETSLGAPTSHISSRLFRHCPGPHVVLQFLPQRTGSYQNAPQTIHRTTQQRIRTMNALTIKDPADLLSFMGQP